MSQALYRRYRPESFADVIGQEHVTVPLMQALRTGRVNHAYLFSGPRGCGKTTSARILARCLNCEQGPTDTPCGECESCVALARGGSGSVDVIEIDAASHGGVEDARDLREKASYGPARSRYKIYIIDEAHMVTPQGFNALLKIVEEPPEHVKFVFATTEPEKVIGTIRSRTHHYPFRLVPPARLQDYLAELCERESVPVEPGVLSFVVRAGGGSVRDSLSVLDQLMAGADDGGLTYAGAAALLGFTKVELIDAAVEAVAAGDGAALFAQVDKVIESGQDPRRFVEDLLERLRDLIIVLAVEDGAGAVLRGVPEDQLERMRQQAAAFGAAGLSRAADVVNSGLTEMTGATSPRLHLELICARLLLPGAAGEHGYAARLDRLERRLDLTGVAAGPAVGGGTDPRPAPRHEPGAAGHDPRVQSPEPSPKHGPGPGVRPTDERGRRPGPDAPARQQLPDRPVQDEPSSGQVAPPRQGASPAAGAAPSGSVPPPEGHHPRQAGPVPARPAAAPDPHGRPPVPASGGAGGERSDRPAAGGQVTTEIIRRQWPDILDRISKIRRTTWTLLSTHAQVMDFDGRVLTLGIGTPGIANTFRTNQMHAAYVREAVLDTLGIEVQVEGRPMSEMAGSAAGGHATAAPRSASPPQDGPGRGIDRAEREVVPSGPSGPRDSSPRPDRTPPAPERPAPRAGAGIPGEGVDVGAGARGWDAGSGAPAWATGADGRGAEPAATSPGEADDGSADPASAGAERPVDAAREGVPAPGAGRAPTPADDDTSTPSTTGPRPGSSPEADQGPAPSATPSAASTTASAGSAPDDDEEPVDPESVPPDPADLSPWERARRRVAADDPPVTSSEHEVTDDGWSADDESVDAVTDAGPAVISAVLGGTVIHDTRA